jgi:MFS family permease
MRKQGAHSSPLRLGGRDCTTHAHGQPLPSNECCGVRARAPGAAALGLLAALTAHTAAYGSGHAMGGAYHGVLVSLSCVAALGALLAGASVAWIGGRRTIDGSVLATQLRSRLPGMVPVVAAAAAWFVLGEAIEPHHDAASPALVCAAVLVAAWLLLLLARALLGLLASIAIAVRSAGFAPRAPVWVLRFAPAPRARRALHRARRYARPPPIAVLARA